MRYGMCFIMVVIFVSLAGCVPFFNDIYITPEVTGKITGLVSNEALSGADIYWKQHDDTRAVTDSQGAFTLGAVTRSAGYVGLGSVDPVTLNLVAVYNNEIFIITSMQYAESDELVIKNLGAITLDVTGDI